MERPGSRARAGCHYFCGRQPTAGTGGLGLGERGRGGSSSVSVLQASPVTLQPPGRWEVDCGCPDPWGSCEKSRKRHASPVQGIGKGWSSLRLRAFITELLAEVSQLEGIQELLVFAPSVAVWRRVFSLG